MSELEVQRLCILGAVRQPGRHNEMSESATPLCLMNNVPLNKLANIERAKDLAHRAGEVVAKGAVHEQIELVSALCREPSDIPTVTLLSGEVETHSKSSISLDVNASHQGEVPSAARSYAHAYRAP